MHVQGWREAGAVVTGTKYSAQGGRKKSTPLFDRADASSLQQESSRIELLLKIKGRIKTGFYNNEAVIEDLGHGFAQVLDQTL